MAKTASKKVLEEVSVQGSTEAKMVIQPLSIDFNKEDLNTLVMKVNEIINHINQ